MILFDLVERMGHEPLSTMALLQEKIDNIEVDMPPMNITLDDVVKGLKYAGVEVPSGIRGRLAVWGPMIEAADAAIIIDNPRSVSDAWAATVRTNLPNTASRNAVSPPSPSPILLTKRKRRLWWA